MCVSCFGVFYGLISWTVVLFSQLFPEKKKALPLSGRSPPLAWAGREVEGKGL